MPSNQMRSYRGYRVRNASALLTKHAS